MAYSNQDVSSSFIYSTAQELSSIKQEGSATPDFNSIHNEQYLSPQHEQDQSPQHEQDQETSIQEDPVIDNMSKRTCIPSVQWTGIGWVQGPKRLSYKKDIVPKLQAGDRLMVRKLKRKSTRKNLILEKRPHTKDLLVELEKVLENHFGEKVFFSKEKKTQINIENLSWDENLSAIDLGCEDGECTGTVEFSMFFRIKNEWLYIVAKKFETIFT